MVRLTTEVVKEITNALIVDLPHLTVIKSNLSLVNGHSSYCCRSTPQCGQQISAVWAGHWEWNASLGINVD